MVVVGVVAAEGGYARVSGDCDSLACLRVDELKYSIFARIREGGCAMDEKWSA